jgi:hypothetical protein
MNEKPEALRLANELDVASLGIRGCLEALSAAELRRLHADNERLTATAFQAQNAATDLAYRYQRLREALESIAANACCDRCQEAALVAKAALRREDKT